MQVTTLAEVYQMAENLPVCAVQGTIIELYKQAKGGQGEKAWTRQDGILRDHTSEIKFKIWNKEPLDTSWKGHNVVFEAFNGERGWTGIFTNNNDHNGTITRELRMTKAVEMKEVGAAAPTAQPVAPPPPAPAPRVQAPAPHNHPSAAPSAPRQQATVVGGLVGNQMKEAINIALMKYTNLDPLGSEFWKVVKQLASNGIRVSQSLEAGHLNPAPWQSASPAPVAPAPVAPPPPPPPPAPAPRTPPPTEGDEYPEDSEVPF